MLKKGFGNFIMNNDKEFLATEPIGKLLLRLAIPTLAAQMINMLYNIIDRIYIGPCWTPISPISHILQTKNNQQPLQAYRLGFSRYAFHLHRFRL